MTSPFDQAPPPGKTAYYVLSTCEIVTEEAPAGLHVPGVLTDDHVFVASGQIEGEGVIDEGAPEGWVELPTGGFCGMQTTRPPRAPYVEGVLTEHGFVPCSRRVVY